MVAANLYMIGLAPDENFGGFVLVEDLPVSASDLFRRYTLASHIDTEQEVLEYIKIKTGFCMHP